MFLSQKRTTKLSYRVTAQCEPLAGAQPSQTCSKYPSWLVREATSDGSLLAFSHPSSSDQALVPNCPSLSSISLCECAIPGILHIHVAAIRVSRCSENLLEPQEPVSGGLKAGGCSPHKGHRCRPPEPGAGRAWSPLGRETESARFPFLPGPGLRGPREAHAGQPHTGNQSSRAQQHLPTELVATEASRDPALGPSAPSVS